MHFPDLPAALGSIDIPGVPADIVAGLAAVAVAILFGIAILRLSGIGASIATFAMLAIVTNLYSHWDGMTAGTSSVMGFRRTATIWSVGGWIAVALIVAYLYQISRWGLSLRASRDDEVAARASGVRVLRERLIAFAHGAFFVGVSGSLMASYLGSINIQIFWLDLTFTTLVMLIVGGSGSLAGAFVGVVVISLVVEVLRASERGFAIDGLQFALPAGAQEFGLAVLILLVLMFRPRGLTKWREIQWPLRLE
jgi:branched-chain amino acid transport system permease protein